MKILTYKFRRMVMVISGVFLLNHTSHAQAFNYFAGQGAGSLNTGNFNVGVGDQSIGASSVSSGNNGNANTAIGVYTLNFNDVGSGNTAVGYTALKSNSSGNYNVAVGMNSLVNNETGSSNVANGWQTLYYNTSGYKNTATGTKSLYLNSTGYENCAYGNEALYNNKRSGNSAFGASSLYTNSTGGDNNAFGYMSLFNSNAESNCAFGSYTLYSNTTGQHNCAFGTYSLDNNINGNDNSAYGYNSLTSNTTGSSNVAFGDYTMDHNTTGSYNTAAGSNALHLMTGGSYNVATGQLAGSLKALYNKCTFIGAASDATANNKTNATAIGYNAKVDASNKVRVGNTSVTSIGGQVGWTTSSDRRLKTNIKDSKLGLDFILNLHPVTYNYFEEGQKNILYTGLIAQEVDEAAQKEGVDFSGVDKNGEYWGIRYGDLTVPLIKGMQEQQTLIESQQDEISALKNEVHELKEMVLMLGLSSQKINTSVSSPQLFISPNPAGEFTTIQISSNQQLERLVLEITDSARKLIRTYQSDAVNSTYNINTSTLNKGVYLVQLLCGSKILSVKKLVVQ